MSTLSVPSRTNRRGVFICLPSYGPVHTGSIMAAFLRPARRIACTSMQTQCSLLAQAFNIGWCEAITRFANGEPITHFAMLHADIQPEDWWVDTLVDELEETGADVVSAVVPIKTDAGLTSSGIARHDDTPLDRFSPLLRLTMRQVMELPATFSAADCGHPDKALLVNTGCWVCRLDAGWCFDFPGFNIADAISERPIHDAAGKVVGRGFKAEVEPEDWRASRWWSSRKLSVLATRKVRVLHHGHATFGNDSAWGSWREDGNCDTAAARELSAKLGVA